MMDIKKMSKELRESYKNEVKKIISMGLPAPCLGVIIVGNDPASETYVRNKEKACEACGIINKTIRMPEDSSTVEVIKEVRKLNEDPKVHGILVQLPLPKQIHSKAVLSEISPKKDVDGFTPQTIGEMFSGNIDAIVPCTPWGGLMILNEVMPFEQRMGSNAVVIGRSIEVGQPFAKLLMDEDMTVTVCHSKTKPEDLKFYCQHADVLVCAAGKAKMITADMVKPGAIILDVGINYDENGKLCGDVDYDEVSKVAKFVSPVPGGCGPMTITALLENTITLFYRQVAPLPGRLNFAAE